MSPPPSTGQFVDDANKISARNVTQHIEVVPNKDTSHIILAGRSLGTAQLEVDGHVIYLPCPSSDPNDPLKWSNLRKLYIAALTSCAAFFANFMAVGPTIDIVSIAMDFTNPLDVQKTSYFFSTTSLWQGLGIIVWMPLVNKYGRRIIYLSSTFLFLVSTLWAALSKQYGSELVARMVLGFAGGGAECLAPLVIADIFFQHERGRRMAFYNAFLAIGASAGSLIDGLIVISLHWRWMYWIFLIVLGTFFILIFFTFEETLFTRTDIDPNYAPGRRMTIEETDKSVPVETQPVIKRKTWVQRLKIYHGSYTQESLFKMTIRPFGLLFLPAVAFATGIFSVTCGFLVAITSNWSVAMSAAPYNFTTTQCGLGYIGGIIGALIGVPTGGYFGDWVARYYTRKNGGVFQPEYRLPAIAISVITGPLALVLYGCSIEHGWHWIVPIIALGLWLQTLCHSTNLAMTYAIDVYKPVTGEVVTAILGFKAVFGFAFSFGANSWIDKAGYQNAFGQMAAICAFFMLLYIPIQIYGARLREASFNWRLTDMIVWSADRDDLAQVL